MNLGLPKKTESKKEESQKTEQSTNVPVQSQSADAKSQPAKPAKKSEKTEVVPAGQTSKISLSSSEKIGLISNLNTMLAAGIPILETVDSLIEDSKGNQRKLLATMRADLVQGQQMNITFAKFPNVFDKVVVNIIKASEEAGTLDVSLNDLKETIVRDTEFNDRIKSALIYPLFIVIVFFAVLLMILVVVVPKISTVFLRLRVTLPLPTKIMIFMSNGLLHNTIPVIIGIIAFIVAIIFIIKKDKKLIIRVLSSLPLISKLTHEIDLTRFTRSFYLLLNAGLPITSALELCEQVVVKKDIAKAIRHTKEVVSSGKKLSEGLKDSKGVIPPIIIKITEAGEKSGSMDKSMLEASQYLSYQVEGTLKTVTSLIEPVMLVFIGALIGGMMLAIIAPIYSLIGQISPQH